MTRGREESRIENKWVTSFMDGEAPYRSGAFQYYAIHTMTITWGEITKSLARVFLHIFNAALPHLHNRVVPNIRPKNQRISWYITEWARKIKILKHVVCRKKCSIRFKLQELRCKSVYFLCMYVLSSFYIVFRTRVLPGCMASPLEKIEFQD